MLFPSRPLHLPLLSHENHDLIVHCSHLLHLHLTICPRHGVSSSTSGVRTITADRSHRFPHSSQQSGDQYLSGSMLATEVADLIEYEQVVVEYQATQLHGQPGPTSTPPTIRGNAVHVYFCCRCNDGPQVVEVNPCCANCGVRMCASCTVLYVP